MGILYNAPCSHSLSMPSRSTLPLFCPPRKTKKKHTNTQKTTKSNLCCSCTHWSLIKLSVASPLKITKWPPHTTCQKLWRSYILQHLCYSFSVLSSIASCLDCYFLGVEGSHRNLQRLSLSAMNLQSANRSFLVHSSQQHHGSWASPWFLSHSYDCRH